jgi:hypothetical protein
MDERDIMTPAIDGWSLSKTQSSERARESFIHTLFVLRDSLFMNEWMKLWWHLLLMDDLFPKHKSEWSSLWTFEEWKYVLADDLFMDEWNCGWMISLFQEWNSLYSGITHERKIGYCRGKVTAEMPAGKLYTNRLPLHGWMKYHDTCCGWMISFQGMKTPYEENNQNLTR